MTQRIVITSPPASRVTSLKGSAKWLRVCENATRGMWTKAEQRIKSPAWIEVRRERVLTYKAWLEKHQSCAIENARLLQVGPGGDGEVFFWASGERHAIDPLASFFKDRYREIIDPTVAFVEGKGEEMPYPDDYFDHILCTNVLDHTDDDEGILHELSRVLKGGRNGLLILEVHVFGWLGHLIRTIAPDVGHPYNYTPALLDEKVRAHKFVVIDTRHDHRGHRYGKPTDPLRVKLWRAFADTVWQKRYHRYLLTKP